MRADLQSSIHHPRQVTVGSPITIKQRAVNAIKKLTTAAGISIAALFMMEKSKEGESMHATVQTTKAPIDLAEPESNVSILDKTVTVPMTLENGESVDMQFSLLNNNGLMTLSISNPDGSRTLWGLADHENNKVYGTGVVDSPQYVNDYPIINATTGDNPNEVAFQTGHFSYLIVEKVPDILRTIESTPPEVHTIHVPLTFYIQQTWERWRHNPTEQPRKQRVQFHAVLERIPLTEDGAE